MRPLIAVDWGTSSLRVARVDVHGRVLEERSLPRGILTVPPGGFPAVFQDACGDWMRVPGALALVCGMAGSRQGWIEAPYCACPAGFRRHRVASRLGRTRPDRDGAGPAVAKPTACRT